MRIRVSRLIWEPSWRGMVEGCLYVVAVGRYLTRIPSMTVASSNRREGEHRYKKRWVDGEMQAPGIVVSRYVSRNTQQLALFRGLQQFQCDATGGIALLKLPIDDESSTSLSCHSLQEQQRCLLYSSKRVSETLAIILLSTLCSHK